ncbi:MAG: hypothetical protein ACI4EF_06135 [Coprococcus sp.]
MSNINVIDEPCGKGYNLEKVKGYEYLIDNSGDTKAVQRSTGEVVEAVWMLVPVGSRVYTPESLGYIFKMLPYINLEYNVLCKNPLEQNLENIEFMSLAEFCHAIDYDISQLSRLLKIYKSLTFEVKTKQERFCAFVYDGLDRGSARIFINPHILYNGSSYSQVKVLGKFCTE